MEKQQQFTCQMHPEVIKDAPGICPICGMNLVPVKAHSHTEVHADHSSDHITQQQATHHSTPEIHSGHDANAGHDKHAGHHTHDFLKRFWICLLLTLPVLALSHMIQQWFGLDFKFTGDNYILLLFGSVIYFYGGMPFFKGMISEIKDGAMGMMTLV